jgi:IclR family pca regulon transcriptional regulator
VLLAGLLDEEIDEYMERTRFEQLTPHTTLDLSSWAAIEAVRSDGYALVDQELEEGVRSTAAPIRNGRGKVLAAMNVSAHASRVAVQRLVDARHRSPCHSCVM